MEELVEEQVMPHAEPHLEYPSQIYEIRIQKAENGYIVSAGCRTFVFEDLGRMMDNIQSYLINPGEVAKNWLERKQLPV